MKRSVPDGSFFVLLPDVVVSEGKPVHKKDRIWHNNMRKYCRMTEKCTRAAEGRKRKIMKKIILASQSPRRRELLTQIGLEFEVHPAGGEEIITSSDPVEVVKSLAAQKAGAVKEELEAQLPENWLVIGADTIVVYDGKILGKPRDEADAVRMLTMLQGQTHSVYTGVTLLEEGKQTTFAEETKVTMYPMTEEEIHWYVDTKEPMDKAGAYGIQGLCARFVKEIQGDYNNVVGLPVGRIYQELKDE